MKWEFTSDEFLHVWRETGRERVPALLTMVSTARTVDIARQLDSQAAQKFPPRSDPELSAMLLVTARPATRVSVVAEDVRILGSELNGTATLLIRRSGRIDARLVRSTALPNAIVDAVPHVDAGRVRPVSAPAAELSSDSAGPVLQDPTARPAAALVRALLRAPRTGTGHVVVERRLDSEHPAKPAQFGWIDIESDGRYLLRTGRDIELTPASPDHLRLEIERHLRVGFG